MFTNFFNNGVLHFNAMKKNDKSPFQCRIESSLDHQLCIPFTRYNAQNCKGQESKCTKAMAFGVLGEALTRNPKD
jgi:hypothetical protein